MGSETILGQCRGGDNVGRGRFNYVLCAKFKTSRMLPFGTFWCGSCSSCFSCSSCDRDKTKSTSSPQTEVSSLTILEDNFNKNQTYLPSLALQLVDKL